MDKNIGGEKDFQRTLEMTDGLTVLPSIKVRLYKKIRWDYKNYSFKLDQ